MGDSNIKPLVLYGLLATANSVKVAIVLRTLNLPYELHPVDFTECKQPAYLAINPNGRCPALSDPNTGLTLWESGAIIEYLVEKYDTRHTISFSTLPEKYHLKQWLHFQASGQGPYFGQLIWFSRFHPEYVPSAVERFSKELERVMGVIELALKDTDWLVGGRVTYADLALVPWFHGARKVRGNEFWERTKTELPRFHKWWNRLWDIAVVKELCDGINVPEERRKEKSGA